MKFDQLGRSLGQVKISVTFLVILVSNRSMYLLMQMRAQKLRLRSGLMYLSVIQGITCL